MEEETRVTSQIVFYEFKRDRHVPKLQSLHSRVTHEANELQSDANNMMKMFQERFKEDGHAAILTEADADLIVKFAKRFHDYLALSTESFEELGLASARMGQLNGLYFALGCDKNLVKSQLQDPYWLGQSSAPIGWKGLQIELPPGTLDEFDN